MADENDAGPRESRRSKNMIRVRMGVNDIFDRRGRPGGERFAESGPFERAAAGIDDRDG